MSLADNIIRALGIEPEQLKVALQNVIRDAAMVKKEVTGASAGLRQSMQHFDARIDRLEANQRDIMRHLGIPLDVPPDEPLRIDHGNGKDPG